MGRMSDIDVEVQELLEAVTHKLGAAQGEARVASYELGRWLEEAGWVSPTEAQALRGHVVVADNLAADVRRAGQHLEQVLSSTLPLLERSRPPALAS